MLHKVTKIRNGDTYQSYKIYKCDKCEEIIKESWPHHVTQENKHYCVDCAFKLDYVNEEDYLRYGACINLDNYHAAVNPDGEIVVWSGLKTSPWEREDSNQRNSPEYVKWRRNVFERDNYTCQVCGQKGGNLNAHHIKSFSKHKELRTKLSNGITLCEECHKEIHRK